MVETTAIDYTQVRKNIANKHLKDSRRYLTHMPTYFSHMIYFSLFSQKLIVWSGPSGINNRLS
jgi:hypothetical protein